MGGYDLEKISGDIVIRYAKKGETFTALGSFQAHPVETHQVVYTDDKRVMCWLWNHKDSKETAIDLETKTVLFVIDSLDMEDSLDEAIENLSHYLKEVGASPIESDVLSRDNPSVCIEHLSAV